VVPSDLTLRVKSLESLLVEKGLVDPAALGASAAPSYCPDWRWLCSTTDGRLVLVHFDWRGDRL